MCKANSCLAVFLHGAFLTGSVALMGKGRGNSVRLSLVGFSAVLLSATAFYFAGMRLAPCAYLLSFNSPGGLLTFMTAEGIAWAVLAGITLPVGYRLGEALINGISQFRLRPLFYYSISSAVIVCCWAIIAFITIAEFAR